MRNEAKRSKPIWRLLYEISAENVEVAGMKAQIMQKIGPEKFSEYFHHFAMFLTQELHKTKFEEFCYLIFGKEDIALHNKFILTIYITASRAKLGEKISNSFLPSGSPKRIRTERKARDCSSVNSTRAGDSGALQGDANNEISTTKAFEKDNNLKTPDLSRPLLLSPADLPEAEFNRSKRQRVRAIASPEQGSEDVRAAFEVAQAKEVTREVNEDIPAVWINKPLTAPLGIPFCSGSVGSARRLTCTGILNPDNPTLIREQGCCGSGELHAIQTLHQRMQQVAKAKGCEDLSEGCANLMNHALEVALKTLIKACVDLKGGSSDKGQAPHTQITSRFSQEVNSSNPGYHLQKVSGPISFVHFLTAMELNPQQLGEDWPIKMEKMYFRLLDRVES